MAQCHSAALAIELRETIHDAHFRDSPVALKKYSYKPGSSRPAF